MNAKVVKRDGKIVAFNEERIKTAIEKGLASVNSDHPANVERVFNVVIQAIEEFNSSKIEIERIQDFVEEAFLDCGFVEAYKSFKRYRKNRAIARDNFTKGQHNLMKTIEKLTAKETLEEDSNDTDSAMNLMFKFGATLSNSYTEAYLLNEDVVNAHKNGVIHIHDLESYPMGTISSCHISLDKLFNGGFKIGDTYIREPQSIESYTALTAKVIETNLLNQNLKQSISMFDYYMADGVLKSFKKNYIKELEDYHDFTNLLTDLEVVELSNKIKELKEIKSLQIEVLDIIFKKALALTDKQTYQAIEALMFNLNTIISCNGLKPVISLGFGTDTSIAGRMVSKNLILVKESDTKDKKSLINPTLIFNCKDGVNFKASDSNYDLFKLAIRCNTKGNTINFNFANPKSENVLSSTTINLARIGIKHCLKDDKVDFDGFYEELFEVMDLVKYQLIDRLNIQKQKKVNNLNGQNLDEDGLDNGLLAVGFTGLAECLKALVSKQHGEDEEAYKLGLDIISKISKRCELYSKETGLNFVSLATNDEMINKRFVSLDKEEFGEIEGITINNSYTSSFLIPETSILSKEEKALKEGSFHKVVNHGQISFIELDKVLANIEEIEETIYSMKDNNFIQGAIKIK